MSNMSYCRHENTLKDLRVVLNMWNDFDASEAEDSEITSRKKSFMRACASSMSSLKRTPTPWTWCPDTRFGEACRNLDVRVGRLRCLASTQWSDN